MNQLVTLGRILFGVVFIIFGVNHFVYGNMMVAMVPSFIPAPLIAVYLDGLLFVVGGLLVLANKRVSCGGKLIAVGVLLPLVFVQAPQGMANLATILKDAGLFAAALMLTRRS